LLEGSLGPAQQIVHRLPADAEMGGDLTQRPVLLIIELHKLPLLLGQERTIEIVQKRKPDQFLQHGRHPATGAGAAWGAPVKARSFTRPFYAARVGTSRRSGWLVAQEGVDEGLAVKGGQVVRAFAQADPLHGQAQAL